MYNLENIDENEHQKVLLLLEFVQKEGRKPRMAEEYKGVKVGEFFYNIRYCNVEISQEDRELLEDNIINNISAKKRQIVHNKVLLLLEFSKEKGRKPKGTEEYKGVKIGEFFNNIRYGNTKISQEDKELLESNGISIAVKNIKEGVHNKVLLLIEFVIEKGRNPKSKEEYKGVKLGNFLHSLKCGNTRISQEDRELLKNNGISITSKNIKEEVHNKVLLLVEFRQERGRDPKYNEEYKGIKLGDFLRRIKNGYTQISEEDKSFLINNFVNLDLKNTQGKVNNKVLLLLEFIKEKGRMPKRTEEYKGVKIGNFYKNIRMGYTQISREDRELLENNNVKFSVKHKKEDSHRKVLLLVEFKKEKGRNPKYNEEYKGIKLGNFLSNVKYGNTQISQEDIDFLENNGISITVKNINEEVHNKVLLLVEFGIEKGRVPKKLEEYKGVKLGDFFYNIKGGHTQISNEDRKLLENNNISLSVKNIKEEVHRKVLLLVQFKNETGRIPKQLEEYQNIQLGRFFYSLKAGNTRISDEDKDLLKQNEIVI